MAFRVGQKVECVREPFNRGYGDENQPRVGGIYTIRSVIDLDGPCLRVAEIINPVRKYREGFIEVCFDGRRFRPIVERKTDISIFTAMLNPSLETLREIIREQVT